MFKFYILTAISCFCLLSVTPQAQTVDFNTIVIPVDTRARDFEEYLVQLAWQNHPSNRILEFNRNIAEQKLKVTKNEFLEQSGVTFNLNQANLKGLFPGLPIPDPGIPTFYPVWNMTAALNLGLLTTRKNEIAIAKEDIKITEAEINEKKLKVRLDMLTLYRDYLLTLEIYKSRINAFESAATMRDYIKAQFEKNSVEFDDFTKSEEAYFRAEEAKIVAENEITLKKLMIEEMTGVKWETIERYKAGFDKK